MVSFVRVFGRFVRYCEQIIEGFQIIRQMGNANSQVDNVKKITVAQRKKFGYINVKFGFNA